MVDEVCVRSAVNFARDDINPSSYSESRNRLDIFMQAEYPSRHRLQNFPSSVDSMMILNTASKLCQIASNIGRIESVSRTLKNMER
jgi:hypothetical protein